MRTSWRRAAAAAAVAALALAGCGDGGDGDEQATSEEGGGNGENGEELDEEALDDMMGEGEQDLEDPNEDVEDGIYRGSGLVLPVPDGWSLDAQAFAQGIVLASNEEQTQVMGAQVVDAEEAEAAGQALELEPQLDNFREQLDAEPTVDQEVELANAEQAHQLTFEDLPAQQEGQPDSSATIVLAEGEGAFGQFSYEAASEDYDPQFAELLVEEAGFDPDSDPPAIPQAPVPEGGGGTEGAPEGAPEQAPEGGADSGAEDGGAGGAEDGAEDGGAGDDEG